MGCTHAHILPTYAKKRSSNGSTQLTPCCLFPQPERLVLGTRHLIFLQQFPMSLMTFQRPHHVLNETSKLVGSHHSLKLSNLIVCFPDCNLPSHFYFHLYGVKYDVSAYFSRPSDDRSTPANHNTYITIILGKLILKETAPFVNLLPLLETDSGILWGTEIC